MQGLEQAAKAIRKAKKIAIACHVNPDGDAIGSLLSLGLGLEKMGKKVHMLSGDGVPKRYKRLPGAKKISRRLDKKVDLAISVDVNTRDMLGGVCGVFDRAGAVLEIDHHEFREPFGDFLLLDEKAAAVGEMIYFLFEKLKVEIGRDIAQNILTSVIVETNSFRLPTVRPFTFELCAELMALEPDFYKLAEMVFWTKTKETVLLSGVCLSRCKFLKGKKLVWSVVRKSDFRKIKGKDEDIDAVPDEMRSIKGVKIAVLFREKSKGVLRVSLRSKNNINIAAVAQSYDGGGHYDVAGCKIPNTPKAMKELLERSERLIP